MIDDQSMQSALTQLLEALVTQKERAGDEAIGSLGPELQAAICEGPESFEEQVLMPWEELINASVRSAFPDITSDQSSRLAFLYLHADFMEHHLERLFQRFEGLFACADKTRWVLQCYQDWLVTGIHASWPPDDRKYWHPKTESLEFWLGACSHLERLYYGYPDMFLEDLQTLVQAVGGTESH